MRITILQSNLSKSLNIISRAVATKSNLEILSYILLKTEGGRLKLQATNLEIGISFYIGGKINKGGEVAVPARLFIEYINSLPNKKIEVELENNYIKCSTNGYESTIKTLPAEDFPIIPQTKKERGFKILKEELKKAINLVSFSTALDETRLILSGIYFNIKDDVLTVVATDSYRLSEKKVKIENLNKKKGEFSVILPLKSFLELSRILEGEGEMEVFIDENQVLFKTDEMEFTSRIIDGDFPDYKKIIPESSETKVKIDREEFLNAIKTVSLFSKENNNSVNLNINKKGEIKITSPESQIGNSTAVINAEVEGRGGEISFNSKYLLDVLVNINSKIVVFEMNDSLSACTFRTEEDKDYIYIVMPLRG